MTRNGAVSFWWDAVGVPSPRNVLLSDTTADVCIVGGGFTGLWTAYYLKRAEPRLRVVVLEQRFCGYGASGRNGGWLMGAMTGTRSGYARSGRDAVLAMGAALRGTVGEVERVCAAEGIDADLVRGGELTVARTPAQLERLRAWVAEEHSWGELDHVELSAAQTSAHVAVAGTLGGAWTPHCARIHPVKLLEGLRGAALDLGVVIHEGTPVTAIEPGVALAVLGRVTSPVVIRATEGFTASLRGARREWLPMNSSMIVTERVSAAAWDEIGWRGRETLGDMAHMYLYAQRTADDRIAIGGRGVPYKFGSRTDTDGRTPVVTVASLTRLLHETFPAVAEVPIAHAWSGVLGVPRDWCPSVGLDRASGVGWAGGYVGHGVAATNLAGRTLSDLILERDTDLVHLPWVGRRGRRWEPEPLRWLGVRAMYAAYRTADRIEQRPGVRRTSVVARVADKVAGR
ncbi:MAG: FAD-dependent oxidoreductase [Frankiales bacterium]|nr:FAD-dependent oxidoreductase [Frankiales bacterium]